MTIITSLHEFRIQIITSVRAVGFLHICNGVHGYEMVFSMEGSSKLQQTVYVHKKSDIGRASLHAHHAQNNKDHHAQTSQVSLSKKRYLKKHSSKHHHVQTSQASQDASFNCRRPPWRLALHLSMSSGPRTGS